MMDGKRGDGGDMLSFDEEEDAAAVRVEKPGMELPLGGDRQVQKWKEHDELGLPKEDDAVRNVNLFSALKSQMSEVKISQAQATDPTKGEHGTWRAFDFSTVIAEKDKLDDTKQEKTDKEQDSVKEGKGSSTDQLEEGNKDMDVVEEEGLGGKEKQENRGKLVEEHEEVKEKKSKEKKEKNADKEDNKEKKEKKEKEKKDKMEKKDVHTLTKKLEKINGKIEHILAKKQQYEQQLKEAKEWQLQRAQS